MTNSILAMTPDSDIPGKWSFNISQNACHKILDLCLKERQDISEADPYLKISVNSGGCVGFQYEIDLKTIKQEDEIYFTVPDFQIQVGIDPVSLEFLSGSCLDYEETMMNSSFIIKNPQAQSTCGCGNSFSIF